jgi:hypothetical protein
MHDPIPWYLDENEARRRGLKTAGWYVMGADGDPVVGACRNPEDCIVALGDLNRRHGSLRRACCGGNRCNCWFRAADSSVLLNPPVRRPNERRS